MGIDLSVTIGGEAGQGIHTVGSLLTLTCKKAGLHLMAINDYESRIRGGHNFFKIRISDQPVHAPHHQSHLLVALDRKSIDLHQTELVPGGLIFVDGNGDFEADHIVPIPFNELSKKAGSTITANTIAAGASLALLGAPLSLYKEILTEQFHKKGDKIVTQNLLAADFGYQAVKDFAFKWSFPWTLRPSQGILIDGAKAIALGALAGDCRVAAFYPMSPATDIINYLSGFSDDFPLIVEQAEDEIAAINMTIGAAFAGTRAMTATSGGGFCLMTEGLGLAGMTETPIVVVNAQRPGPATGLPTRTAQGDLQFVIKASQDEFPRFVFAPGTVEEAFETTARAFHLAEKYQVPAIILVDHFFNSSLFTTEASLVAPKKVETFTVQDGAIENIEEYKRYRYTSTGVSPRALPCRGRALVIVSGNEHKEDGHITEEAADRINMVNKRKGKLPAMEAEMNGPRAWHEEAATLLVGWGSTQGALREAVNTLRKEDLDIGCLCFNDLWPFNVNKIKTVLNENKKFIIVEENSTSQLGQLISEQMKLSYEGAILKYDGRPFYPYELVEETKKLMR